MNDDTPQVGRREFLKQTAALTALGVSCLGPGLKEALAQAKKAGKPLLTEKALNAMVKKGDDAAFAKQVKAANTDLVKFLSSHFHLTETQIKELGTISPKDKRELAKGLEECIKHHVRPTVQIRQSKEKTSIDTPSDTVLVAMNALHAMLFGISISVGFTNMNGMFEVHVTVSKTKDS